MPKPLRHYSEPPPPWTPDQARAIAEQVLGCQLDQSDCAPCPGRACHTLKNGRRDFRLFTTGQVPVLHCVHQSCSAIVAQTNKDFYRALFADSRAKYPNAQPQRRQKPNHPEIPHDARPFAPTILHSAQLTDIHITPAWLRERSPIDPATADPTAFLHTIFRPGETALIFTREYSQGDYAYQPETGWLRLGQQRNIPNTSAKPPTTAKNGVFFLNNPVDGQWHYDATQVERPWSRRRADAITTWRHMVIESDHADPRQWVNFLIQFPWPILALYTSGGKSIHALVRLDAATKEEWDFLCGRAKPLLSTMGADPKTLSASRLTRLPGCLREGKYIQQKREENGRTITTHIYEPYPKPRRQKLLYLAPNPSGPIADQPRYRNLNDQP